MSWFQLPERFLNTHKSATDLFIRALNERVGRFGAAALATLVSNLLTLGTSLFAMQVYDRVVPNQAYQTLWTLFAGVAIAVTLESILKSVRATLLDLTGKGIELELGQKFFNKALSIRMDARPPTIGTFAAQIRDFDAVKSFITSTTLYAIADAPFAILFVIVIAIIGGHVALVPLAAIPITLLIGWFVQKPLEKLSQMHMQESSVKNGMLVESIDGAETILATGGAAWFSKRWYDLSHLLSDTSMRIRTLSNLATTLGAATQQLCYALTVATGVYAIGQGHISMGALVASSILVSRVLAPISQLTSMAVSWHHAKSSLNSLNDLMKREEIGPPKDVQAVQLDRPKSDLRCQDVKFTYGIEGMHAMSIERLRISGGERVAIIGPSGSGKSTLLKLLSGLFKAQQGRIYLSGVDQHILDPRIVRETIAYLPQDVRLFNGTLKENICLGLQVPNDDKVMEVAGLTGLDRVIAMHPRGLGLQITEGGRGLSGGQRQMVGLSRTLLQSSKILLLDEPTASMDPSSEAQLIQKLHTWLSPDQTLIVVTHKPAILQLVNRIIVVDQGQIAMDGEKDAVLRKLNEPRAA